MGAVHGAPHAPPGQRLPQRPYQHTPRSPARCIPNKPPPDMKSPLTLGSGIRACFCIAIFGAPGALTANNEDAPPRGSLNVGRDIVRAGTRSQLAWEIEIPQVSPVDITPEGAIIPKNDVTLRVRTLGVAFQSGSTQLPIASYWSLNGGSWAKFFEGKSYHVDPTEVLVNKTVRAGDRINFGARGKINDWLPFHSTGNSDNYVTVLKNGETPPDYAPAYDQGDIVSFMQPYVDASGKIQIGPRDLIVLWECSTSNPGSPYFDMQDIVVLVTFE